MITAKAKVWGNVANDADSRMVTLGADYANGRNQEWSSATPNLHFTLAIKNEIAERFPVGATFTVTFEENAE